MTAIQTGSGLRSRKVDPKRAMAVVRFDHVNDLDEDSMINTTIPKVATGVEKEEEEEHHLQQALVASQTKTQVVIPTPDASSKADLPNYKVFYTPTFHLPKSLIKYSALAEEVIGCLYNLSDNDYEWLESLDPNIRNNLDDDCFENLIYCLDEIGSSKVSGEAPLLEECESSIAEYANAPAVDAEIFELVYEYWKDLRYAANGGQRVRPILKSEHMSSNPDNDPYVCFRQREIKSFRKVRRSDTLALDKIRKLKDDMLRAKQLIDLVHQQEKVRKDALEVEHLIFEERVYLRRLRKHLKLNVIDQLDSSPDAKSRKKAKRELRESTKIRIPMQNLKDASHLMSDMDSHLFDDGKIMSTEHRIEEKIKREKALNEKSGWCDCTESPYKSTPQQKLWGRHLGIESRLSSNIHVHMHNDGSSFSHIATRRRIGRGGRVMFDRYTFNSKIHVQDAGVLDTSCLDPQEILLNGNNGSKRSIFQAFQIAPKDEQYIDLQNRPAYNHTFDPKKNPYEDGELLVPQIVRTPHSSNGPGTTKKKVKSVADTKPSTNSTKKKTPEILDARTQAVKTMMKQAQKQAQQTQAQIQLHQANQNATSSPVPIMNFHGMPNGSGTPIMQQKLLYQQMQSSPNQSRMNTSRPSPMPHYYFNQMQGTQMRMNMPNQQIFPYMGNPNIPPMHSMPLVGFQSPTLSQISQMGNLDRSISEMINVDENTGMEKVEGLSDKENLLDSLLA